MGFKSILVFLSLALILAGSIMVIYDPERVFTPRCGLQFDDPMPADTEVAGEVTVNTLTKNAAGEVVRRYDPDITAMTGSLLDPATDSEVKSYIIEVNWVTSGTNIDWTTLHLDGAARVKYIGIGFYGQAVDGSTTEFDTIAKSVDNTGTETISHANLDSLVPSTLPDIEWNEDPDTGRLTQRPVSVDQRGPEKHAVIFKFTFEFALSVDDLQGNTHTSNFAGVVELRLAWAGSTFEVEWNKEEATVAEAEEVVDPPLPPPEKEIVESKDTVLDTDMTNIEADEFVNVASTTGAELDAITGSIFGGGVSEDIGIVLIGLGVGLLILVFFAPNLTKRRK